MIEEGLQKLITTKKLILYDGDCRFCNRAVRFILDNKPSDTLRFVAHQSDLASQLRKQYQVVDGSESMILISNGGYTSKSAAAFGILGELQSMWRHFRFLRFIPVAITDFFYDLVANNRYRIKAVECELPSSEEKKYFLT